jgi:cell fate (sporulation/competence/biofilm development) regulator YlbF (YheA/YmcA/DUF963 family)
MPKKNNNLNQYVKELEEYKDRILNIHENLKTNPNSFQSFMDMEREIFKETNKGKSRKKTEK